MAAESLVLQYLVLFFGSMGPLYSYAALVFLVE